MAQTSSCIIDCRLRGQVGTNKGYANKKNKHKRTIVRSKFKKFKSIYSENIKYKLKYTI